MNTNNRDRTLEVLQVIHEQSNVTQRSLATRLDVALGLANAYLKRCVRKGLIKVQQAPANRYLYYLTPQGFSEKSRLTALYLRDSFDFYRRAGESMQDALSHSRRRGYRKLLFAGASELAEIGLVRAREYPVTIRAVYDPGCRQTQFLDLPVWRSLDGPGNGIDACVLTCISAPEEMYRTLLETYAPERILVPDILGLNAGGGAEAG